MSKKKQKQKAAGTGGQAVSWRGIRQTGRLRSSSAAARKRRRSRMGRTLGIALLILLIGGGLAYALYFSGKQFTRLNPAPKASTLKEVDFVSDGVLDREWFERQHPLPGDVAALDFDIHALKRELETFGQINRAEVEIALPSTLIVRVEEKQPVLRARVRDPEGRIRLVLIASDGTVFSGERYPPDALRHLPGLVGAKLKWSEGGIQPVPGVEQAAELLRTAREITPDLYTDWQWVSFERFEGNPDAPDALISVKSGFIERIVFAPHSFEPQLQKLNEVVLIAREQESAGLRKVDLSYAEQAIVQY